MQARVRLEEAWIGGAWLTPLLPCEVMCAREITASLTCGAWCQGSSKGDGASNGTRTRGIQDHNLALYQLSYARH